LKSATNDNEHRFVERELFLMQYSPTENPEEPSAKGGIQKTPG